MPNSRFAVNRADSCSLTVRFCPKQNETISHVQARGYAETTENDGNPLQFYASSNTSRATDDTKSLNALTPQRFRVSVLW